MIHTKCLFDESTTSWDPKHLRKSLCIPEDQLKILNSLSEWSKAGHGSSNEASKISACLNSQSSQLDSQIPPTKPSESQYRSLKNIELFNKSLEGRRTSLVACNTSTKKLRKCFSADDICEDNTVLSHSAALKRTLSASDIHLKIGYLLPKHLKESSEWKTYTFSDISQISESKFIGKASSKAFSRNNQNIPHDNRSKELLLNLKPSVENMEVVTQIPVTISCADKNINNGVKLDVLLEKQDVHDAINNVKSKEGSPDTVNIANVTLDIKSNTLDCDKVQSVSVIQPNVLENNVSKENNTNVNILNEANQVESESVIQPKVLEGSVSVDNKPNSNALNVIEFDKRESSRVVDLIREVIKSCENIPENKNSMSNGSNVAIIEEIQILQKNVAVPSISVEKPLVGEAVVAVKRKAESKKSSKKRRSFQDKKIHDPRNIKRSGEISYSVEEMKTMLDIVQQFL